MPLSSAEVKIEVEVEAMRRALLDAERANAERLRISLLNSKVCWALAFEHLSRLTDVVEALESETLA